MLTISHLFWDVPASRACRDDKKNRKHITQSFHKIVMHKNAIAVEKVPNGGLQRKNGMKTKTSSNLQKHFVQYDDDAEVHLHGKHEHPCTPTAVEKALVKNQ